MLLKVDHGVAPKEDAYGMGGNATIATCRTRSTGRRSVGRETRLDGRPQTLPDEPPGVPVDASRPRHLTRAHFFVTPASARTARASSSAQRS